MARKTVGVFSACSSFDGYDLERKLFEGHDVEIVGVNDAEEFAAKRGSFDALILTNAKLTPSVLADMPNCRVICRHGPE